MNVEDATKVIKMPTIGDTVEIFGFPRTRKEPIGKHKVLHIEWNDDGCDGGIFARVTVKRKGEGQTKWMLWVPQE